MAGVVQRGCGILMALLAAAPAMAAAPAPHDWKHYFNSRFRYLVCYPSDLMRPEPEADNGDGRVFTGRDGARMTVFGSNNALDLTVPKAAALAEGDFAKDGMRTVYRTVRADWYALSATGKGREAYSLTLLSDGAFTTYILDYPVKTAPTWRPLIARINGCFRDRAAARSPAR